MAAIHAPSEHGFDKRLDAIDHCQIALLAELASQCASRLVLKGGMAMRAAFGSMRLTKDLDFDRDPSLNQAALRGLVKRGMEGAAETARILHTVVQIRKDTPTTFCACLQGRLTTGVDVRFDVEVSGRGAGSVKTRRMEIVTPPQPYAMTPFPVLTYTDVALAAMKVAAALSPARHAVWDLYDLRDLIRAGADPTAILARQEDHVLADLSLRAAGKLEMLSHELARNELFCVHPARKTCRAHRRGMARRDHSGCRNHWSVVRHSPRDALLQTSRRPRCRHREAALKPWRIAAEKALLSADNLPVLTTAMLHLLASTAGATVPLSPIPSSSTLARWQGELVRAGKLEEVTTGVYLNVLGHRAVSPAAAAHHVHHRSVVSLSWVLEQAGISNNYSDTITCVIPTHPSGFDPHVDDLRTAAGPFRFFGMLAHLAGLVAGRWQDVQDERYDYRRATPEKALLDWIYLGASPRSRLTRPPFDTDVEALDQRRLARLLKSIGLQDRWEAWHHQFVAYQTDEEVQANASLWLRL